MQRHKEGLQTPPNPSRASSYSSLSMEAIPQFIHPDAPGRKRSQGISVNSDVSASSSIHRSGSVDYHPAGYPTRPPSSKPSTSKAEAISASEDEVESALNMSTPDLASAEEQRRRLKEVKVVRRRPASRGVASTQGLAEKTRKVPKESRGRTIKKSTGSRLSREAEASVASSKKELSRDRYPADLQLSGDSSGDGGDSSEDDTLLPREQTNRVSSAHRNPLASDSSDASPPLTRRADSIDSTATSHSVIVKRPRASQKPRRQAIEQFVTDVETELRSLRENYDAAYERCVRTLQDTQRVQTM